MRKSIILTLLLVLLFTAVRTVEACTPPPEPKYFNCDDLGAGYKYGFLISGAANDRYPLTARHGTLTGGAPSDPDNYVKISNSKNGAFQWASSLGIDAVIVDAGPNSKVFRMKESSGGTAYAPRDGNNRPYAIKKVEFCYDYELSVTKTAEGTTTGKADWEISKDVTPAAQAKFAGETATFDYTVQVQQANPVDSSFVVSGKVVVENHTPLPAIINSIKDTITPGSLNVTLDCGGVKFPYTLAAHKTLTCTYKKPLNSRLEGENQAVVTTAPCSKVSGGSAVAKIVWQGTDTSGSGPITVTDTNAAFGGPQTVQSGDKTWKYPVELSCPSDPAQYTDGKWSTTLDNTATIVETGQKASQTVKLDCYAPSLSQSIQAGFDRQYTWTIEKSSDVSQMILRIGQTKNVSYNVNVAVASKTDSHYQVSGAVTIANPNPDAPMTVSLSDLLDGNALALTGCDSPLTIPAGGSQTCKYASALTQPAAGANQVTAALNGMNISASAAYDFSSPAVNEIDECVNVTDDKAGSLGSACADQAPKVYTYILPVGPYADCGDQVFDNTASFVTNDTQATGSSKWEITLQVSCDTTICTYTEAYWKRSADPNNPLYYDATWDKIQPNGSATPFFSTGKTWAETFSLDSSAHNYYLLAHQYMAAKLNVLRGADVPADVAAALGQAEPLLAEYGTHMQDVKDEVYLQFNDLIYTLQNYNTGVTGPGHCCDE